MLINKSFNPGDVVSIKLINGDEIIARYESENAEEVVINRPLALTMGGGSLGMIPWMFLSNKQEYTLKKNHYFVMVPTKPEAAKQYMQGTTGIALG
jgi:hypothetical protein